MQPWKKESKSPVAVLPPKPVEPIKVPPYKVFRCEKDDLERQLNERFPDGNADIQHIGHFGSAVDVVVKLR